MRRGEAFFEKNSTNGLVAKKSRREQTRASYG
jgi:hypothetical protein